MLVANRKNYANTLKNKTKRISCKKQPLKEHMELETVLIQYTLDSKKIAYSHSFCNCLQILQKNLAKLLDSSFLAKDAKFLRMCALVITESYYKAKNYPFPPRVKKSAKQSIELLTKNLHTSSLLQAAQLFSEQNPQESDLSALLTHLSLEKIDSLSEFICKITYLIRSFY